MIKLLIRKFIKNYEFVEDKKVREAYGVLSGVLGIICNTGLFALKLFVGLTINSIAIITDAFNNFTDLGSSIIAIISAKMSNAPPDENHPLGHGRIEYVSSLVVSFIIFAVGFELLKSSVDKIIHPQELIFNPYLMMILVASVLVKIWMFSYNRYIGERVNSSVNRATAYDSLSDVVSTLAVVVATVANNFLPINIDGIIGCVVSIIILYTGYKIAKDTVNILLGFSPNYELTKKIEEIVRQGDYIVGTHELIVHDYGPGRTVASIHAEVPDNVDIAEAHAAIDEIEDKVAQDLNINIVVHMDPICTDAAKLLEIKKDVVKKVRALNSSFVVQNFRITSAKYRTNLIFDLLVPSDIEPQSYNKIAKEVREHIIEADGNYDVIVNMIRTINEKHVRMMG